MPARVPRMTAAHALERQQAALGSAMYLQRFQRIVRAARIKTAARRHHRADGQLIEAQQEAEHGFHGDLCGGGDDEGKAGLPDNLACAANRRVNSTRKAAFSFAVVAGPSLLLTGLARRTTQSMAGRPVTRNSSRVTRLIVLRVTARGAKRLATTTPSRACGSWFRRVYSTKCALFWLGRKRKTDENSSVLTIRRARAKSCEPSPVEPLLMQLSTRSANK